MLVLPPHDDASVRREPVSILMSSSDPVAMLDDGLNGVNAECADLEAGDPISSSCTFVSFVFSWLSRFLRLSFYEYAAR
jgi:hypothetical protein